MSTGLASQRSASRGSSVRSNLQQKPPSPSLTPGSGEFAFEPCAATASFLLYAQRNIILCLHHDTLAVERRFTRHREDVSWISADTVSERGAGRLVVSYDAGSTAIVWDLFTGDEVARFASYDQIRVASWMRNGNVAFGGSTPRPWSLFPLLIRPQATPRAISSSLSPLRPNTSLRGPFLILSLPWPLPQTAEPLPLGEHMKQHPRARGVHAKAFQISQWLDFDCDASAIIYHSPHPHDS